MISRENFSHAWIRVNTRAGLDKNGITAAVILCFKTEPEESRVTVFHYRKPDGTFEYTSPNIELDTEEGGVKVLPCLAGGINKDLPALAVEAQNWLRKKLKPGYGKLYRVSSDKVEEFKQQQHS